VKELSNTPRAAAYAARFTPFDTTGVPGAIPGFNFKQLRSNLIVRWEYRPGSTLYLVWTQGRDAFATAEGTETFRGDVSNLFRLHPDNTFLIKASYWLDW
jgi:hypothetical protein